MRTVFKLLSWVFAGVVITISLTFGFGWITEVRQGAMSPEHYVASYFGVFTRMYRELIGSVQTKVTTLSPIWSTSLRADEVAMNNGSTMRGFITQQDEQSLWLDVGIGKVRLNRVDVRSIRSCDAHETSELLRRWELKKDSENAPSPKGDYLAQIEELQRQREEAMIQRAESSASGR